jgi:2-methylisocitrate lyase-like PEP mutase family enzyme
MNRTETMEHAALIASATELPVSVDFGDCFGDSPEAVAETIRLSAATGIVGGSVEDVQSSGAHKPYDIAQAAERVRAAAEAAHSLGFKFTLTARAENFITGRPDLKDTIARLQAYQQAGADVLYAPGLRTREEISAVVSSVDRPVNVLMGLPGVAYTLDELSAMGVKRVSVGSALARAAYGALIRAGREIAERGTFSFADEAASSREITQLLPNPLNI